MSRNRKQPVKLELEDLKTTAQLEASGVGTWGNMNGRLPWTNKITEARKRFLTLELNQDQVYDLACRHWTCEEIAAHFNVHPGVVSENYMPLVEQGWAVYNAQFRDLVSECIFDDKNPSIILKGMTHYLKMNDKNETQININMNDPRQLSIEQLEKQLAKMLQAAITYEGECKVAEEEVKEELKVISK